MVQISPWVLLVIHLASGNMEQIPIENGDLCRYTRNMLLDDDATKRSRLIEGMDDAVGKVWKRAACSNRISYDFGLTAQPPAKSTLFV